MLLKNIISTFFARVIIALASLGIILVSSKQLGSAVLGQISLVILNMAIIQIICEIYTGSAIIYFIPKFHLRRLYVAGLIWTTMCVLIINAVFMFFKIGEVQFSLHVLILSFISILHGFNNVILLGKGKIKTYSFFLIMQPVILLVVLITNIFLLEIRSVYANIIAMYISWGLSLLVSFVYVLKEITRDDNPVVIPEVNAIFGKGFMNQLGNLAHTLSSRYNYYLIGTVALVGVYANATSLIESVLIISNSVSPVILTHIASGKDSNNRSAVTFLLCKISFLLSVLCVIIVLLLPNSLFVFILGADFASVKPLMMYLSPGVLVISFVIVISHYFSGLGEQKVQLLANSMGLLTILCTSYFFISEYHLIGACYAASLAYIVQGIVLVVVFMKRNGFHLRTLFTLKGNLDLLKR